MKKTVVAIVGPTAVGKTQLSIELAKRFNGEIISGDSMQVYKGMDIGTAKISPKEMQGIPHHLIDSKEPIEEYTAADFKGHVHKLIEDITKNGRLPIIVGGSGLYIQAALFDYNFPEIKRNEERTDELTKQVREEGIDSIYKRLIEVDPEQAERIHPNNHRRVIRALEIYETTGRSKSDWERDQTSESPFNIIFVGLEMEREKLYSEINRRVDVMLQDGLLEEVTHLYKQGLESTQAMKAIGYKEFIPYLEGREELTDAIDTLKQNSRRYAKRQYTWFRNKLDINWYSVTPETKDEKFMLILQNIAGIIEMK